MHAYIYVYTKAGTPMATARKPFSLWSWEPYVSLAGVKPSTFGFGLVISQCNDDSNSIGYLERLSGTGLKHLYVL